MADSSNSYSGGTAIYAGMLQASASGDLGTGSALTIGAGTLDVTSGLTWSQNIALASSSAVIEVDSGTFTVSGLVSGSYAFTKTGSGTMALTDGSNSYSGGTAISAGMLQASAAGDLGAAH